MISVRNQSHYAMNIVVLLGRIYCEIGRYFVTLNIIGMRCFLHTNSERKKKPTHSETLRFDLEGSQSCGAYVSYITAVCSDLNRIESKCVRVCLL